MDELKCPHCQSNKYRNPELVMMINNCGHSLCKACVNVVFHRESSKCTYRDCGRTLYKKDFRVQIFEDSSRYRLNMLLCVINYKLNSLALFVFTHS